MARHKCSNCGQMVTTPFCGYCGRRLALVGLEGLLAHIQTRIKVLETGIQNSEERQEGRREWIEKNKKTLEKWKSWYKELYDLMSSCGKKFKLPEKGKG